MRNLVAVLLLSMCYGIPQAFATPPAIPDTPAGHTLQAWLDAFNSADEARVKAYCQKYDHPNPPEVMLDFSRRMGGFELVAVDQSQPLHIEFRVKEKASPRMGMGVIDVKDGDPVKITGFRLRPIPPGMSAADLQVKVDTAVRGRVLDGIAAKLTEFYVFPDLAKKMVDALRAHQRKGEYDKVDNGYTFATLLTDQLQAVSHDKHLRVECVPKALPKEEEPPKQEEPTIDAEMRAQLERDNCGFEKVERLESNIGYVKFNFFGEPTVCGPTATAAMNFLGNVDAIIFDLRSNGGGDPKMVAYLSSYLFNERTHLNDLWERKTNKTTEYWTKPDVPGKKLAGKLVFVLTSKGTFSGAEEFSYNLKNLKRATIVGEVTGGGAHPTDGHRVDDHFLVAVPFARAVNPISKTNWEGKGVEPDFKVPAIQALEKAKALAIEQLAKPRRK